MDNVWNYSKYKVYIESTVYNQRIFCKIEDFSLSQIRFFQLKSLKLINHLFHKLKMRKNDWLRQTVYFSLYYCQGIRGKFPRATTQCFSGWFFNEKILQINLSNGYRLENVGKNIFFIKLDDFIVFVVMSCIKYNMLVYNREKKFFA